MLQRRLHLYRFLLYGSDLCLVFLCWLLAYWLRFTFFASPAGIPPCTIYFYLAFLHVAIFAVIFPATSIYRGPGRGLAGSLGRIFSACVLGVLLGICIVYFIRPYDFSRGVYIIYFCALCLGITLYRPVFFKVWSYLSAQPAGDRALIVGSGRLAQQFCEHVKLHPELGINLVGFVAEFKQGVDGLPRLGDLSSLPRVLRAAAINTIIITLPMEKYDDMQKLIKSIGNELVDIKILLDFSSITQLRGQMTMLDNFPLINLHGNALEGWPRVGKRLLDTFGAMVAMILFSPIMLGIAIWIKKCSPGPIIYRQQRMGLDGRLFYMYKFRTMVMDAERNTGPVWAADEDPRCIPFGNWLRKRNLDELPQFYNVLKGEMSLVGPRPERPELIAEFKDRIPGYMLRHRVKAGVTGWAQINGWRGPTSLEKRIEYDLYYIENWSFKLDIMIIAQTIGQTIAPRRKGGDA